MIDVSVPYTPNSVRTNPQIKKGSVVLLLLEFFSLFDICKMKLNFISAVLKLIKMSKEKFLICWGLAVIGELHRKYCVYIIKLVISTNSYEDNLIS